MILPITRWTAFDSFLVVSSFKARRRIPFHTLNVSYPSSTPQTPPPLSTHSSYDSSVRTLLLSRADAIIPLSKKQRDDELSLLDLPREVRALVYAEVVMETGSFYKPNRCFVIPCGLSGVSKQIGDEMPDEATNFVVVRAKDFAFTQVVTLLNKLNYKKSIYCGGIHAHQVKKRLQTHQKVGRRFNFGSQARPQPDSKVDLLHRWVKRFSNSAKRGTDIKIEYCCAIHTKTALIIRLSAGT